MADYPMTSPSASTPQQQQNEMRELHEQLQRPIIPDPLAIQQMLATLARIPRETIADWLAARRMWAQRGELDAQRRAIADAGE